MKYLCINCVFWTPLAVNVLALSVIANAMPPFLKGEALAFPAKFPVLPRALPLGELLNEVKMRGRGC